MNRSSMIRLSLLSTARTIFGLVAITVGMLLVPDTIGQRSSLSMFIIVLVGLGAWVLYMRYAVRAIRRSRYPRIRSAETLLVSIWLFIAVFASFYVTISAADEQSFTEPLDHFTAAYFALTVLATVGFGDITPVTTLARSIAMVQMGIDLFIIGVAVKVLTSSADRAVKEKNAASDPAADPSIPSSSSSSSPS